MTRSSGRINQAVEIKKVSHGNIKDFLDLIEGLARFENRAPLEDAAKRRLEIDALAENPPFETFLAYRNDRPVGYVIYYHTYATFEGKRILFLEDIFVLEDERKSGLGSELFKFCLREAKRQGCDSMEWAVLTWNENAISFYERMGGKREDCYIYGIEERDFETALRS